MKLQALEFNGMFVLFTKDIEPVKSPRGDAEMGDPDYRTIDGRWAEFKDDQFFKWLTDDEAAEVIWGKPSKEPIDAQAEHPQTACLMLPIRPQFGRQIVSDRPGRTPLEELHVTLMFLGNVSDIPPLQYIEKMVWDIVGISEPIVGKLNGVGHFDKGPDGIPFYANFDSKALPGFRQVLVDWFKSHGVVSPSEHGYTPHITLFFYEGPTPNIEVPSLEIEFDAVRIQWGDRNFDIPFGGREHKLGSSRSGFYGHKGRLGKRGGSTVRGGTQFLTQADGWDELPQKVRDMFLNDMAFIPSEHLKNLRGIEIKELDDKAWHGRYLPYDRKIILDPTSSEPGTLIHEVGHHVFEKVIPKNLQVVPDEERKTSSSKEVGKVYLENDDETFAEVYKLHIQDRSPVGFDRTIEVIDNIIGVRGLGSDTG